MNINKRFPAIGPVILLILIVITITLSACTYTGGAGAPKTISPAAQPDFQVIGLGVNPASVKPGEEVQVVATISNAGNGDGEYTADLKVNGVTDEIRKVSLPAGTRQEITFRLSRAAPQVYQVKLGEIAGQFAVNSQQQTPAAAGASCCTPAQSGSTTSSPAVTSTTGASCCTPTGSGTLPVSAGAPANQPAIIQPAQSQRRSCCQ